MPVFFPKGRVQIFVLLAVTSLLPTLFVLTTNAAPLSSEEQREELEERSVRFSGTVRSVSGNLLILEGAAGAINGEFPDGSIEVRMNWGTEVLFAGRARYETVITPGARIRVAGSLAEGATAVKAYEVIVDAPGEPIAQPIEEVPEAIVPDEPQVTVEETPAEPIPAETPPVEEPIVEEVESTEPPITDLVPVVEEPIATSTEPGEVELPLEETPPAPDEPALTEQPVPHE